MFYKIKATDSNIKGFIQRKNCDSYKMNTRVKDFVSLIHQLLGSSKILK